MWNRGNAYLGPVTHYCIAGHDLSAQSSLPVVTVPRSIPASQARLELGGIIFFLVVLQKFERSNVPRAVVDTNGRLGDKASTRVTYH